jgi:hypothetical protein
VVNSSQGGGSKDTWVLSPPREPAEPPLPDLTTIEFAVAELPEDHQGQDPGPLGDPAIGQSQQQQQLKQKDPSPLDTRTLAPSLRTRPQC